MPEGESPDFRPCLLAPTYNNARTLGGVLAQLHPLGLPVIVVDDGSTDDTAAVLSAWCAADPADHRPMQPPHPGDDHESPARGQADAAEADAADADAEAHAEADEADADADALNKASTVVHAAAGGSRIDRTIAPRDARRGQSSRRANFAARFVVTHPRNHGKAAALRSGFARARRCRFTHVLTIDTDGQHQAWDVAPLLALARRQPHALVLGERPARAPGCPWRSRAGRWISNQLVRLQSGLAVSDSQSGLRVYPLVTRLDLFTRAGHYGFETEYLTRCGWAGAGVVTAPVGCAYDLPGGRVSHFGVITDSLRAVAMHARLTALALLPRPAGRPVDLHQGGKGRNDTAPFTGPIPQRAMRYFSPARVWRTVRSDRRERKRFAAGLGAGVMIANIPLYGLQTVLCLIAARKFRLPPFAVIAGSHLSVPPVGPMLIAAAVAIGHLLLHGRLARWDDFSPATIGYVELLRRVAVEWAVGSVIVGGVLAVTTYVLGRLVMALIPVPPSRSADEPDAQTR